MFRLISWLIYMMTNQQKRESSEYLWMVYEKVKYSQKKWEQNLYGCILHRIFRENGANIPIETEFADYPVFPHGPSGVFISQGAKIGKNCVIFQQVTIIQVLHQLVRVKWLLQLNGHDIYKGSIFAS